MGLFTAIGSAISSAVGGIFSFLGGGSILARIALAGLSIAARYALQRAFGRDEEQAQTQASQLETRYGENLVRTVVLGTVGTAGHRIYRNAYGRGNAIIQDVYVLSHFRINGVTRVRFKGQWCDLGGTEDAEKGFRLQGVEAEIWVKVHSGTMDQAADYALVNYANPTGRWTVDHRGAGVAYAVVTSVLHREHLPSPDWSPLFEVEGAPLYDWRLDSTAGGSGAHRWADQSTWSFTTNPVVMMYALERGIFNGSELIVGKGADASDLPLSEWSVAANICDELIEAVRRYQASCIVSSGDGVTHDNNMQPLLAACAASWLELAGEEYPIVGANQASVATITDDDVVTGEPFRFSAKRPRTELVNTVAGTFVDPANFYASVPIATRIDAGALAADRERLAVSIGYGAVTVAACVDRLADIAIRASRYQARADICLRPKFLALKPGQWLTWTSERYGWTKVFQVMSKRLGGFGTNSCRNVYLALQEVGEGVFDPTAYATVPPDALGQGAPDYQSELQNFQLSPYVVVNDEGQQYPAIRATWDAPDDPTVVGIEIQYRPQFQPEAQVQHPTLASDVLAATLVNGVVSSTVFEGRHRLVTFPYRVTPWSDWSEVTTPAAPQTDVLVSLKQTQADIINLASKLVAFQREVSERVETLAASTAEGLGASTQEFSAIVRTSQALAASYLFLDAAVTENADGIQAAATAILGVQASVNTLSGTLSAGGLISFEAQVPAPSGVLSQINILARASDADDFIQSGFVIQVLSDGGSGFTSRIVVLSDVFAVSDGTNTNLPLVYEGGVLKLAIADIGTVTAGTIQSGSGKMVLNLSGEYLAWYD